jgi:hypothetical protein
MDLLVDTQDTILILRALVVLNLQLRVRSGREVVLYETVSGNIVQDHGERKLDLGIVNELLNEGINSSGLLRVLFLEGGKLARTNAKSQSPRLVDGTYSSLLLKLTESICRLF